jgi:hypothetical protein
MALDFVSDWCTNGPRLKLFTLLDRLRREALAVEADYSFPVQRVVTVLERLRQLSPCPKDIRVDNLSLAAIGWPPGTKLIRSRSSISRKFDR